MVVRQVPYGENRNPREVIVMIERGERPEFGDGRLLHHSIDAQLRILISRCWAQDPEARPDMAEVLQQIEKLREAPMLNVTDLTDQMELLEDARSIYASGGFGDVRRALLRGFGPVALKTLVVRGKVRPVLKSTKVCKKGNGEVRQLNSVLKQRFMREASIWSELHHPNILPFLGTADLPDLDTCLVSPWMFYGNCVHYLEKQTNVGPLVLPIVRVFGRPLIVKLLTIGSWQAQGVTQGLQYLHGQNPPVIHGDLRGVSVLTASTYAERLINTSQGECSHQQLRRTPLSRLRFSGNCRRPHSDANIFCVGRVGKSALDGP